MLFLKLILFTKDEGNNSDQYCDHDNGTFFIEKNTIKNSIPELCKQFEISCLLVENESLDRLTEPRLDADFLSVLVLPTSVSVSATISPSD